MNNIDNIDMATKPLLKALWSKGIETYQSCSGHEGAESFPSAYLWMGNDSLTDEQISVLVEKPCIEQVSRLWGREKRFPVIEIVFAGETLPLFDDACTEIERATATG